MASLAVIVALDVPWQIWSHLKKLRMSKEDVRQEHKESEGDPHVKARIRQQQRQAARRRMMADVPKADVVTNPTHYAVALRYDESKSAARAGQGHRPDRGQDPRAGGRTQDSHIEAPLARALHQHVELGQEIPAELYTAVAEVLAWCSSCARGALAGDRADRAVPPACAGRAGPQAKTAARESE